MPEGLLVCIGDDTNLPSSTLRLARGNVDIDLSTKKIQITDSDGVVAIVREATDKEATATWAYIGNYSPDDLAFMKKHADYFYTVQANQSE
ncbi:hypothetical protein [Alteromonas sp. AMM-1]|uniref:hypothetical protein n=1 Tax=Alteromonas sp. AMM-1 TaxID=3394233 RepID=UPI0039A435BA